MPRRKRTRKEAVPAETTEMDAVTLRKLSECGTRAGLEQCLHHLSGAGWLSKKLDSAAVTCKKLTKAVSDHANATTPYGPVLQFMDLGLPKLARWAFVPPLALLYYMAQISAAFGEMMLSVATPGKPLRIIIYIDEICPGNPLRPEKARTLQAIYWAVAGWPQRVLR